MLILEFKGFTFFIHFRKYVRAFKDFQKSWKKFLDYVDFFFYLLNILFDLFLDVCITAIRGLDFKFYCYGWSSHFSFFIIAKLWITLFEDFGWRFWWVWCKTISLILNLALQILIFLHLNWIIELFFQYYCNIKKKIIFFFAHSRQLDWDKIFVVIFIRIFSLLKIYMCLNLFFSRYFFLFIVNTYKSLKKMLEKRKKYLIKRKLKARKLRLLRLKRFLRPLKFYWSLINWEYEPLKFLWEFYYESYIKFCEDWGRICYYYEGLYQGLRDRIRGIFYDTGKNYSFIYFFFWLTYYLTIIANGIYIKYLVIKFIFFSCKYLWSWIFFFIDFTLKYFFEGTIIYWLHIAILKRLYRFVNFFIFICIPNILSYHFWIQCLIFLDLWFNSIPHKIESFFFYLADLKYRFFRFFFSIRINISLMFFSFIEVFKAFKNKILNVKNFFLNYYLRVLFIYSVSKYIYSKKGLLFWNKIFEPRINFLLRNVKEKNLKFLKDFSRNQIGYRTTKIKLYFNKVWGLKAAFLKYKIAVFLDLKTHYLKAFIICLKLIKLLTFFCLHFLKLLIKIQCFYFAMNIKFNEFYMDNRHEKVLNNLNLILEQLEEKIAQNCRTNPLTK